MMPMKYLIMKYVTICLMCEMFKKKEREPEGDDAALVLYQGKVGNPSWRKDIKTCYYCGNQVTMRVFATRQEITIKMIQTIKKMMTMYSQCNMNLVFNFSLDNTYSSTNDFWSTSSK